MFNVSKYTKWYYSIIENAKKQERTKCSQIYYEDHHIIPKCMGGTNKKINKILLTAREHFICHVLLVKMTSGKNKMRMAYAFYRFVSPKSKTRKEKYTSKIYAIHRKSFADHVSGPNSYMYGVPKTKEQRAKIAATRKALGYSKPEANPMYGKNHTTESKQLISQNRKLAFINMPYEKSIEANPLSKKLSDGNTTYLSIRDAARQLGVHRRVIQRMINDQQLVYL